MALTLEQIRELVLEGESNRLEFKREQYHFVGLSGQSADREKSKLLKDVLAFANAFRKEPAFILIGVDESLPSDQAVTGIPVQDVLDDATLQQFVNSKTNKTIPFRAYPVSCPNSLVVEVFEFAPCPDDRPFYLKKDFGGIVSQEVWFRVGSSNTKATPDDIARMGAEKNKRNRPVLECEIESPNLIVGTNRLGIIKATTDLPPQMGISYSIIDLPDFMREPTDRERFSWLAEELEVVAFSVRIRNRSSITAEKILVEIHVSGEEGKTFKPFDLAAEFDDPMHLNRNLFRFGTVPVSLLRPGEESSDFGVKTIRVLDTTSIDVTVRVFADNLEPIVFARHFEFKTIPHNIPKDEFSRTFRELSSPERILKAIRAIVANEQSQDD